MDSTVCRRHKTISERYMCSSTHQKSTKILIRSLFFFVLAFFSGRLRLALPILGIAVFILGLLILVKFAVISASVISGSAQETSSIDQVSNDSQKDQSSQEGQAGGGARGIEVKESALLLLKSGRVVEELFGKGLLGAEPENSNGYQEFHICWMGLSWET